MVAKNVMLHMNIGDGETSYAKNSGLQRAVILKTLPVLDDTLEDMFVDPHFSSQRCYKLVDFGCASGPNSLCAMTHIVDAIENMCREKNIDVVPEFEVYLNDLPGNDFNNLFKLLPNLHGEEKGRRFVYGLPGSFYGRLFPKKTIHFGYSSYSLHWLSQVPQGLGSANKENIYLALESPPEVVEAYSKQFQRDFSTFIRSRAEEMIHGGRMVLSFIGRSHESTYDDSASRKLKLLAETFVDMVNEGLVKLEDLHSFNMPHYEPCKSEVRAIVEDEGSFTLDRIEDFLLPWDANNNANPNEDADDTLIDNMSGKFVAHCVRAFMEPMVTKHFGNSILDDLFERYAKKVGDYMSVNKTNYLTVVVEAYTKQFQRAFSTFIRSRAEEMIHGGRMVLSFIGRSHESTYDDSASRKLKLLAETFIDMVNEGLVKREDLHSFNMPHYEPCKSEVRAIVEDEGSFTLDRIEDFLLPWDANRNKDADDTLIDNMSGKFVAHCIRAVMEPMVTKHFGYSILDDLFERYAKKVGDYMSVNKTNYLTIVISLTRK